MGLALAPAANYLGNRRESDRRAITSQPSEERRRTNRRDNRPVGARICSSLDAFLFCDNTSALDGIRLMVSRAPTLGEHKRLLAVYAGHVELLYADALREGMSVDLMEKYQRARSLFN